MCLCACVRVCVRVCVCVCVCVSVYRIRLPSGGHNLFLYSFKTQQRRKKGSKKEQGKGKLENEKRERI